jgi:anti-sigma factor RsiW
MACSISNRLSAYHDGELDAASRVEVERHLSQCPACAVELAELKAMSNWFEESQRPRLSQIALYRIHGQADWVVRKDLLRFARTVQAIAACVLVAASIGLMWSHGSASGLEATGFEATGAQAVQAAPPWLGLAVQTTAETNQLDVSSPAAAVYLADVSSRSDEQ